MLGKKNPTPSFPLPLPPLPAPLTHKKMSNVREMPQPVVEYIILLARVAVMNVGEPAHCTVTQLLSWGEWKADSAEEEST